MFNFLMMSIDFLKNENSMIFFLKIKEKYQVSRYQKLRLMEQNEENPKLTDIYFWQ
jgi:hypothetical protein